MWKYIIPKEPGLKMLAVSLSNRCVKSPRCSFCYLPESSANNNPWYIRMALERVLGSIPVDTICFEYSGYNLDMILNFDKLIYKIPNPPKATITTMPELVTDTFCRAVKSQGVSAISISYDDEKVRTPDEWIKCAEIARTAGLKVGCNYLIQRIPMNVPIEVARATDQLNLLALKPSGKISPWGLQSINFEIEVLKNTVRVTTDNCLGVQLGYIKECRAGIDFLHVLPNGTITPCCFGDMCFLYDLSIYDRMRKEILLNSERT